MKNTLMILIALVSFTMSAQNKIGEDKQFRQESKKNFTPEQKAELHSKKLTLELDLTDSQQKEIYQVLLKHKKEKSTYSKKGKEISSEEKYEAKKAAMNQRIALKREFKNVLTKEQYEKWERKKHKKNHPNKMKMQKNKKERKGKN